MSKQVYIRPVGTTPGPQSEHGDAVRLAGGMVYAHRFAVIVRDGAKVTDRWLASPATIDEVLGDLPDSLAAEAERQWSALRFAHPALQLGERTVHLDQPQVMGMRVSQGVRAD